MTEHRVRHMRVPGICRDLPEAVPSQPWCHVLSGCGLRKLSVRSCPARRATGPEGPGRNRRRGLEAGTMSMGERW
jgi:hypothetical protein